jgi:hypothetical protein
MKEFRDSISGKGSKRDDDDDDDAGETRSQANAALGRPDDDTAPAVEGEVVSERTRT